MIDLDTIKLLEAQAVKLWESLSGARLSATRYQLFGSSISAAALSERLQEAMRLDPTGISTLLIMRHAYNFVLDECSFTLRELVEQKTELLATQQQVFALHDLLFTDEQGVYLDNFTESVISSVKHYGKGVSLKEWAEVDDNGVEYHPFDEESFERNLIGYLRLDALIGMDKLSGNTFIEGTFSDEPVKYNRYLKPDKTYSSSGAIAVERQMKAL